MTIEIFTDAEIAMNRAEGWDLFNYDTCDDGRFWTIQKLDDPDLFPGEPPFGSDVAAYSWCRMLAKEGSERHQRALLNHGERVT